MSEKVTFSKIFLSIFFFSFSLFSNTLGDRIQELQEKRSIKRLNKDYLFEMAVLYLYQENFSKSFEQFNRLYRLNKKDPFNLFYMAMIKSYLNERDANFFWRNYFQNRVVRTSRKLWSNLGTLVRKIVSNNLDREKNKALFERNILFFYLNKAFYTSMLNINIYEKYVLNEQQEDFLKDINFVARIKAGILSNIGYKLDAIKVLEKYGKKYTLTNANLKKLAILYYQNNFYIQSIEIFNQLESLSQKDFSYYYFLALANLRIDRKKEFREYREIAKTKIVNESHRKLFENLSIK